MFQSINKESFIIDCRGGIFHIALEDRFNFLGSIPLNSTVRSGVHLLTSKNFATLIIGIYRCMDKCFCRTGSVEKQRYNIVSKKNKY